MSNTVKLLKLQAPVKIFAHRFLIEDNCFLYVYQNIILHDTKNSVIDMLKHELQTNLKLFYLFRATG